MFIGMMMELCLLEWKLSLISNALPSDYPLIIVIWIIERSNERVEINWGTFLKRYSGEFLSQGMKLPMYVSYSLLREHCFDTLRHARHNVTMIIAAISLLSRVLLVCDVPKDSILWAIQHRCNIHIYKNLFYGSKIAKNTYFWRPSCFSHFALEAQG